MSALKTYLGDAVYADMNRAGCVILTVEDSLGANQCIVLDAEVMAHLVSWAKDVSSRLDASKRPVETGAEDA